MLGDTSSTVSSSTILSVQTVNLSNSGEVEGGEDSPATAFLQRTVSGGQGGDRSTYVAGDASREGEGGGLGGQEFSGYEAQGGVLDVAGKDAEELKGGSEEYEDDFEEDSERQGSGISSQVPDSAG